MGNHKWTTGEIAKIREMLNGKIKPKDIIAELGLPAVNVYNQIRRIKAEDKKKIDTKCADLPKAEKEPAPSANDTSSTKNDIKTSTDSISLNSENVKLQVEFLKMVSDTLDEVYQSTDYNAISPTLATGFGRAWGILDYVINTLADMLKAGGTNG